jgi:predicted ester cyclase
VRFRTTGTQQGVFAGVAPTHKHIDVEACNVLEIRNGKTVKGRLYMDTATILRQLGVLSLPKATTAG